jgi:chromatin remodeling complex protein RSC6
MSNDTALDNIVEQFATINDSITLFKMQLSSLHQQLKTIEKNVKKEVKNSKKDKKTSAKAPRAPSGFAKPTKVTKELCHFMDKPEGTEIARTEVTKALISYIKSNNLLEESENTKKKKIVPDEKLKNLLGIDNDKLNELTYFNIQKYMNKHFCKNTVTTNIITDI